MQIIEDLLFANLQSLLRTIATVTEIDSLRTIRYREVQTAVRLAYVREIAKHGVSDGYLAVRRWQGAGTGPHTKRAGVTFPVPFFKKTLKESLHMRVSWCSAVYLAAAAEYVSREVIKATGRICGQPWFNTRRIAPRHVFTAVSGDAELREMFPGTFAGAGIIPSDWVRVKVSESLD